MLGTTPRRRRALALIDGNSPRPAGLHSAAGKLSEVSGRTASIGPQESPLRVLVDGCNGPEMEGRQPPARVPTEEIPRFLDAPSQECKHNIFVLYFPYLTALEPV